MAAEQAADVTLNSLMFEGQTMRVEIANSMTQANLKRTIDGAPTLSLTFLDPMQKLVTSGLFAERITAQIDGKSFSLVQLTKSGSMLTTVFEDLAVAAMRTHTNPTKVEANTMTRFDFAKRLLAEEGTAWIPIYMSPGATLENTKVELARGTVASSSSDTAIDENLFSGGAAVGGAVAITDIARYAAKAGFSGDNLVLAVAVSRAENGSSQADRVSPMNTNGTFDHGLWQVNSVHKDLFAKYNWKDPQQNAYMAKAVWDGRAPGHGWEAWSTYTNKAYLSHMAEAKAAVNSISSLQDLSGSTDTSKLSASQQNKSTREKLLGGAEDTWTCIKRIFAEINWTCYIDWDPNNVPSIYVGPDSGFLTPVAEINITPEGQGIDNMDYDYDIGKSTATMTIQCRAHRWQLPPGTMVNVPLPGHLNPWLVSSIDRNFFSLNATVTLKKPEPALPEPEAAEDSSGQILSDMFGDGDGLALQENVSPTLSNSGGGPDYSWPVAGSHKITGNFGEDRPGHKHAGIDIGVPEGTPVYASRSGVVKLADADMKFDAKGYGKIVQITHRTAGTDKVMGPIAATEETWYAHLSKVAGTRGQQVNKGDLIGTSGQTGNASGPCLHFEIRKNGTPVNPLPFLQATPAPAANPAPAQKYSVGPGTVPNSTITIPYIP